MKPFVFLVLIVLSGCAFESLADAPVGGTDQGFDEGQDVGADMLTSDQDVLPQLLTVNTTDDVEDGSCDAEHCSLRDAVAVAHERPGSTIDFDIPNPVTIGGDALSVIVLGSPLEIRGAMTIEGPIGGREFVEIRADFEEGAVFELEAEDAITLENLEISAKGGGGVRLQGPHVLRRVTIGNADVGILVDSGDGVVLDGIGLGYSLGRDLEIGASTFGVVLQAGVGRFVMRDSVVINNQGHGVVVLPSENRAEVRFRDVSVGAIVDKNVTGNGGQGLWIQRPGVVVSGGLIGNNALNGILIEVPMPNEMDPAITVVGTRIGSVGRAGVPNGLAGIDVLSCGKVDIGTANRDSALCVGDCNAIAGNLEVGIRLDGVGNAKVFGNYIGISDGGAQIGSAIGLAVSPSDILARGQGGPCSVGSDCASGVCRKERVSGGSIQNLGGSCTMSCPMCDRGLRPRPGDIFVGNGALGAVCKGACNVIGGNSTAGVFVGDGRSVVLANNFVGVNAIGGAAVPNGTGVLAPSVAGEIEVKECALSGNTEWGFSGHADKTTIGSTVVGLDPGRLSSLGNGEGGIRIDGGTSARVDNCYVGDNGNGASPSPAIWIDSAGVVDPMFRADVVNNYVGLTMTEGDAGNKGAGIAIGRCRSCLIESNVVAYNGSHGLVLGSTTGPFSGTVNGNRIGVLTNDPTAGNGLRGVDGVRVVGTEITGNFIGDSTTGISFASAARTRVSGNTITDVTTGVSSRLNPNLSNFEVSDTTIAVGSAGRAIRLSIGRPSQDLGDLDGGANGQLNYPELSGVAGGVANGTVPVIGARVEFVSASDGSIDSILGSCKQSTDGSGGDTSMGVNTDFVCTVPTAQGALKSLASAKRYWIRISAVTMGREYSLSYNGSTATVTASTSVPKDLRDQWLTAIRDVFGERVIAEARQCPRADEQHCIDLTVAYDGVVQVMPSPDVSAEDVGNVTSEMGDAPP